MNSVAVSEKCLKNLYDHGYRKWQRKPFSLTLLPKKCYSFPRKHIIIKNSCRNALIVYQVTWFSFPWCACAKAVDIISTVFIHLIHLKNFFNNYKAKFMCQGCWGFFFFHTSSHSNWKNFVTSSHQLLYIASVRLLSVLKLTVRFYPIIIYQITNPTFLTLRPSTGTIYLGLEFPFHEILTRVGLHIISRWIPNATGRLKFMPRNIFWKSFFLFIVGDFFTHSN